jgi:tryptophan synthase alpha chain
VIEATSRGRLTRLFSETRRAGRAALIGYLVAGDPDLETTEAVITEVAGAGLDILELGIPYGDPLADGPTIAAAGQRALAAGTTLETSLELVERLGHLVPIVLFSYLNPVYQFGVERFAERASASGAWGAIIPDVTLEEIDQVSAALHAHDLDFPLLIAPTTELERARRIAAASQGFVYVVSRLGVTGEGASPDLNWLRARLEQLRSLTDLPLAVGFGISSPAQVRQVAPWTDGIIVGSGLVSSYAEAQGSQAAQLAGGYVRTLAEALRKEPPQS